MPFRKSYTSRRTYTRKPVYKKRSYATRSGNNIVVRKKPASYTRYKQVVTKLDYGGYLHIARPDSLYISMNAGAVSVVSASGIVPTWIATSTLTPLAVPGINASGFTIGFIFRLSDTNIGQQLGATYDGYKIVKTKMTMCLLTDYLIASNNTERGLIPEVYIYNDYDDGLATPATLPDVLEFNNVRVKRLTSQGRQITSEFTPKYSSMVYKSSGTTIGYSSSSNLGWLDMENQDVEHYGLKMHFNNMIDSAGVNGAPIIRVSFEHIVKCKNQR